MKKILQCLFLVTGALLMSACSVFGDSGVEIASYRVIDKNDPVEIRTYENHVLVTAPMQDGMTQGRHTAFNLLFDYISGANKAQTKVSMTAPVFMREDSAGEKIAMTAPVFMRAQDQKASMSFVLPAGYDFETAPKPTHPDVKLEKMQDYTVAVITFSGLLNEDNIETYRIKLKDWLATSPYTQTGTYQVAGYNPPWTVPFMRRNEILIPVQKK